jgi:PIN domain nuclease of toxin-antitoxin system
MGLTLMAIEACHVLAAVDAEPTIRDPFDCLLLARCFSCRSVGGTMGL